MSARPQAPWWRDGNYLRRFVADLVADEWSRLRLGAPPLPSQPWADDLSLIGGGVGADSLEMLTLASALAEAIHLHESGIEDYLLVRRTFGEWVTVAAAGLDRFHAQITFRTSGSTGLPKSCPHSLDALAEEIAAQAVLLAAPLRILSAVPSHHIYGFLFTVLLPQCLGSIPVIDIRGSSPARLAGELRDGDLVVGHPEFWKALVRSIPLFPGGVVGVTSTAPCPTETAVAVQDAGLKRFIQVYGSTETAGVAWRDSSEATYQLLPYWRRADDASVERDLGGAKVSYSIPDEVAWDGERRFRILRRRDRAVQVAGTNVFPDRVRNIICEHPGVKEAAVRLMSPEEGSRLKAFIVPKDDAETASLRTDLTAWMAERMTSPEQPRGLTFGPALPVGLLGKACDWAA